MYYTLQDGALASSHLFPYPQIDDLDSYVARVRPCNPVSVISPHKFTDQARLFTSLFTGRVMYAVKCNPDERVLHALIAGGIDSFDCSSIKEIRLMRHLKPDASLYYMNPIKPRESIREAYFTHHVRVFVLDSADELKKIIEETNGAKDLTLFVRLAIAKQNVAIDFSEKFGASPMLTGELLRLARPHCKKLGLAFHVGTHCLETKAYDMATRLACNIIKSAGINVDVLDIGGGFPALLDPADPPPPLQEYFRAVESALKDEDLPQLELLCEPGRALVASGGKLVVRVDGRKGDLLYLNDGTYGSLFECGKQINLQYPVRMVRIKGQSTSPLSPFRFAGPTCDSLDMMNGPFYLHEDINEGDYIVIDQMGAYGETSRTPFNGFDEVIYVELLQKKKSVRLKKAA
ncbi:MAG: pyridoxal-dependent decarboxylase [Micavibrio aeruginosavorus]|uniref:ornithine decarboxylase n=1 Tax=Micavibrio aeruginosavorus TaxID=349221 RepID=A0A2W5N912_9BACT|nr:MAG: pyridoxal-dependent decarboxylase [Micavibrio aeruginosavorus]